MVLFNNSSSISTNAPNQPSSHVSDPMLTPFLAPAFSPAAYLNNVLLILSTIITTSPPSSTATSTSTARSARVPPPPDLAAVTQQHVVQLAAHAARLTTTLTALTDDLLRGGGARLAYDVEVLRGEVRALAEKLASGAMPGTERFGGGMLEGDGDEEEDEELELAAEEEGTGYFREKDEEEKARRPKAKAQAGGEEGKPRGEEKQAGKNQAEKLLNNPPNLPSDPTSSASIESTALDRLRTLHRVRTRLQSVITTLNAALLFPFPPSQLSSPVGLVPTLASTTTITSASASTHELAGQAALRSVRAEIVAALLPSESDTNADAEGVRRAEARIVELRALCAVWKGTSEERARLRWVESLGRKIKERKREIEAGGGTMR